MTTVQRPDDQQDTEVTKPQVPPFTIQVENSVHLYIHCNLLVIQSYWISLIEFLIMFIYSHIHSIPILAAYASASLSRSSISIPTPNPQSLSPSLCCSLLRPCSALHLPRICISLSSPLKGMVSNLQRDGLAGARARPANIGISRFFIRIFTQVKVMFDLSFIVSTQEFMNGRKFAPAACRRPNGVFCVFSQ